MINDHWSGTLCRDPPLLQTLSSRQKPTIQTITVQRCRGRPPDIFLNLFCTSAMRLFRPVLRVSLHRCNSCCQAVSSAWLIKAQ